MLNKPGRLVSWLMLWAVATCCHADIKNDSGGMASVQLKEKKWPLEFDSLSIEQHLAEKRNYFVDKEAVRKFYHLRSYQPAWFDSLGLTSQARNLIFVLANASDYGIKLKQLAPDSLLSDIEVYSRDQSSIIKYDVELTARYFEYASIAYHGLNNEKKHQLEWFIPSEKKDFASMLQIALQSGSSLTEQEPVYPLYRKLKQQLKYYRDSLMNIEWEPIVLQHLPLRQGDSSIIIPQIKKRLYLLEDLPNYSEGVEFDSTLFHGIKRFQLRHGLTSSGIIDKEFISTINIKPQQRIRQMLMNMERCRWLPAEPDSAFIMINIPAFKLLFFNKGKVIWKDNVVVGKEGWQTTIFSGKIREVVFNPYWVVPNTILAEEQIQKIRNDKNYLSHNHFEVLSLTHPKKIVDAEKIDWLKIDPAHFPYELRQKPGPWNALGRFKFLFPNSYQIYLHDTPSRNLFSRTQRDFSHGCIRLEHAEELARLLLSELSGSQFERLKSAGQNQVVALEQPVPVFVLYLTSWVDSQGVLNFRKDIYGHDQRMESAFLSN